MAGRLFASCLRPCAHIQKRAMGLMVFPNKIGNRDVVGYGYNGEATYYDRCDFPMPAIRFKDNTPDVMALREKEKGDWKKLSIEEKKSLYRASFCQTFAEIDAPNGDWKASIGVALMGCTLALWIFIYLKLYVYPPLPPSFSKESQLAQLDRMLVLDVNPIEGISARLKKSN